MQVLPSCYGGKADLTPIEVAVKQLARKLSILDMQQLSNVPQSTTHSKLATVRR